MAARRQTWKRKVIALSLRISVKSRARGKLGFALSILQKVADRFPQVLAVRIMLARMALMTGNDTVALDAIRAEAVDHLADVHRHYHRIAAIYLALEDVAAAERYLTLARGSQSQSSAVRRLYGMMFRMRGSVDAAAQSFQEAARSAPTTRLKVQAILNAARTLADAGRADVEAIYQQILDLDPENTHAYYGLVECGRHLDLTDPVVHAINRLVSSRSLTTATKDNLHYALALVHDNCGNHAAAFTHVAIAHRIRASNSPPFRRETRQKDADKRCSVFTSDFIRDRSSHGCQEDILICVVGMPRSGTTLTEEILGSHADVRSLGERDDFWRLAQTLPVLLKTRTQYPECCRKLSAQQIGQIGRMILDRMRRAAGPCRRIVTKLPDDYLNVGMIRILFPKAKIIHCRRNPLDTCLSCYLQNFARIPYARNLDDLTSAYKIYRQMMRHWKSVLPASSILEVRYENLVEKPEIVVRDMCAFAGIQFQESCMEFHLGQQPVRTKSRWQVRRPIYRTSVNRSDAYREFLGPLLELEDDVAVADRRAVLAKAVLR